MLGTFGSTDAQLQSVERIQTWTRDRFNLPPESAVFVSEIACSLPGCPPLETVVGFWTEPERRHHFKIFKPLHAIVADDLPPAWLRDALVVTPGAECSC
ncbi:MAG: hypothetical protein M3Z31_03770 [Pseudomonadota bacterium]|nr:hypothetical protein [Pseudomonadota bacterium]